MKIDPCDTMRNNLIAAAVGLQQCTQTAANVVPLPGTDRFIAIGTAAEVRGLLPAAAHIAGTSQATKAQAEPVAWMNPDELCVMDAFLWRRDSVNPRYSQPVYAAPVAKEAPTDQKAHVLPPFAAPAGQRSAWTAVEDGLPEDRIRVLGARAGFGYVTEVFHGGQSSIAGSSQKTWRLNDHSFREPAIEGITHWMPFPSAPEQLGAAGSAKGGNTNTESSDRAPTTSTVSTPTVQAEQIECWSRDEEDFAARSLDELLSNHDDLKPGDTVWVGDAVHPDPANLVNEDGIIENIGEAAYDIAGEHAEDYPEVTNEQAKELETLVTDWIKRTCPPNFWTVENVKPYVLSHEDFPNDRRPVQLAEPDSLRATSTDQANADGSAE